MADVWVLLLIIGFFGLCVALVRGCDAVIGPDDSADIAPPAEPEATERETAGAAR